MLTDLSTRQVEPGLHRRWISDEFFDLVVWYDQENQIHGFQLCYDKPGYERALTWTRGQGFAHTAINSGEGNPTANRSPILVADGVFPLEEVRREFVARGGLLPAEIRELVLERLIDYQDRLRAS